MMVNSIYLKGKGYPKMLGTKIKSVLVWAAMALSTILFSSPAFASDGIDLGFLGKIEYTWSFCMGFFSIILINIILSGDNAVVIALAVKNLPPKQKRAGIIFGAGAAVVLRIILTFCVVQLLNIPFLSFIGGLLILWIAVKLFVEGAPEDKFRTRPTTIWKAVWLIVIADLIMSTDNVLAVAGACGGNFLLLVFGLALSIPIVVFASALLSLLMEKYPIIIYVGAAILGRVGVEMMLVDTYIVKTFAFGKVLQYSMEAIGAIGVIIVGKLYMRWKKNPDVKIVEKGG
jgi:YjbE family integral membrane protein